MRILVTGSKGAIGQYLAPYLRLQQNHVIGCDIVPDYNDGYVLSDVTKPQELEKIFQEFNPDVVIHLAALYGRLANERYANISIDTNIVGTNNMIQLCKRYKSKLIFFSTSEVYGNQTGMLDEENTPLQPNNRYGIAKKMCEDLIRYEVQEYNLDAVILRLNMVYSSGETFGEFRSALIRFCEALLKKEKITVYKDTKRSWIHIDDAVQIVWAACKFKEFTTMNVGSPRIVDTINIANILCEHLGLNPDDYIRIEEMPHRMTKEKHLDVSKQIELTGITPQIHIEQGAIKVLESCKQRLNK